MHSEDISPILGKAGIQHGVPVSPAALKAAMGLHLFDKLLVVTDLVYESVDVSLTSLQDQFKALRIAATEVLETDSLINIEIE